MKEQRDLTKMGLPIPKQLKKRVADIENFENLAIELETLVMAHPAVDVCVVTPITSFKKVTAPVVNAYLKPEYLSKKDEVLAQIEILCNEKMKQYYMPCIYYIRTALSYTENIKLNYESIRQEILEMNYEEEKEQVVNTNNKVKKFNRKNSK